MLRASWPALGWLLALVAPAYAETPLLDLAGNMKPGAYLRQSVWSDKPIVAIATGFGRSGARIGRTALHSRFVVDPSVSYRVGKRRRKARRGRR